MCQDVCHVIRDHEENKVNYAGPRFFIRYAELEMHPLDTNDRRELLKEEMGLGYCNITKCLYRGLPRTHSHHRQRDHPAEGASCRRRLRPDRVVRANDSPTHQEDGRRSQRAARSLVRGGFLSTSGSRTHESLENAEPVPLERDAPAVRVVIEFPDAPSNGPHAITFSIGAKALASKRATIWRRRDRAAHLRGRLGTDQWRYRQRVGTARRSDQGARRHQLNRPTAQLAPTSSPEYQLSSRDGTAASRERPR